MVQTMRGKHIDMARLAAQNAHKIALGNASMNARGDIISHRGTVMKTNEQITSEYNAHNPKAVRQMALRNIEREILTPAEAVESLNKTMAEKNKKQRKLVEEPTEEESVWRPENN